MQKPHKEIRKFLYEKTSIKKSKIRYTKTGKIDLRRFNENEKKFVKKIIKSGTENIKVSKKYDFRKAELKPKNISGIKPELKKDILNVQERKQGFFKHQATHFMLQAYFALTDLEVSKKSVAKEFGITVKTLDKILKDKNYKPKIKTVKKISQGINSTTNIRQQYIIAQIMQHLKQYGTISKKKLTEIKKSFNENAKKLLKNLASKDYYFLRVHYGSKKQNESETK